MCPVRDSFLHFSRPSFGEDEKRELMAALESGWVTTGPRVARFEEALTDFTGSPYVIAVDSCTAALHIALSLQNLKPGDEVITTPLTFVSTVNAILHAGGTPVLADVEEDTLNLNPAAFAEAITDRTRAVLPVHYAGHPADMDPIKETASKHGIAVIEDAAHAIGATYKGVAAGTLGNAGCFSFYATKNMTTGEGGALLLADEALAERARLYALHGMNRDAWRRYEEAGSWYYEVELPGFKYNMTDLEAALGLGQLQRLAGFNQRRREIASRFDAGFRDQAWIRVPEIRPDVEPVYQLYSIRLDLAGSSGSRADFISALAAENIGTSVHFIPIHFHPYYRERLALAPGAFPVAEAAYESMVSLPIYPAMTERDIDDVIAAVNKVGRGMSL